MKFCAPCDIFDSGVVLFNVEVRVVHKRGSSEKYLSAHPLKSSSKSSMAMYEVIEVDTNGCESGVGRRAMAAKICAWPVDPFAPSIKAARFQLQPTVSVRPWSTGMK